MRRQESWEGKRRKKREKKKKVKTQAFHSPPFPAPPILPSSSPPLSSPFPSRLLLSLPLLFSDLSFLPFALLPCPGNLDAPPRFVPVQEPPSGWRVTHRRCAQRLRMKAAGRSRRGPSLGTAQGLRGMCPPPRGSPHQ